MRTAAGGQEDVVPLVKKAPAQAKPEPSTSVAPVDDLASLLVGPPAVGTASGGPTPGTAISTGLEDFGFGLGTSSRVGGSSGSPTLNAGEALQNHRERELRANAEEEEKFALKDTVDAKILAWRRSKETNIRALLASLEMILPAEMGVKNVALSELITPNQVKIRYMKVIAKVHPDKLGNDTSTERKLIANAVFGTLNNAFDAFKNAPGGLA
ncbi:hypothetical protein HDU93_005645 [Gonapodya sp. JEL0774]|nr:hypothetical protein HDU93_005645 [Gonapodya sp. JEL0774]